MSQVADELTLALAAADEAVVRLEHALIDAASVPNRKDVPLEAYATAIHRIDDYVRKLKAAKEQGTKALSMRVSSGGTVSTLDGLTLERRDGQQRKTWNHSQLKSLVAERVIADHTDEDGAIDAPLSVLIVEALDYPSIGSWKVKPLRAAGINVDSFCKKSDGTISFSVVDSNDTNSEEKTDDDDFI